MAIVKMKRLRLLGMRPDREELLSTLQRLGCVEVNEPDLDLSDPEWAALARPDGADADFRPRNGFSEKWLIEPFCHSGG